MVCIKKSLLAIFCLALALELGCCSPTPTVPAPTSQVLRLVEPEPNWLDVISPEVGSHVPLSLYEADHYDMLGGRDDEAGYDSTICVGLAMLWLVQSGDDFGSGEALERLDLMVDGEWREPVATGMYGVVGYTREFDDGLQASWSGPESFCWKAQLSLGVHQVALQFRQTSGDTKEYVWHFVITDG